MNTFLKPIHSAYIDHAVSNQTATMQDSRGQITALLDSQAQQLNNEHAEMLEQFDALKGRVGGNSSLLWIALAVVLFGTACAALFFHRALGKVSNMARNGIRLGESPPPPPPPIISMPLADAPLTLKRIGS